MGWWAFNFECESIDQREDLLEWFEEHHEVERKLVETGRPGAEPDESATPAERTPGTDAAGAGDPATDDEADDGPVEEEMAADVTLQVDDGEPIDGQLAWIENYLYLTAKDDPRPLLPENAAHWDRAVRAKMRGSQFGGCKGATLFETIGAKHVQEASCKGKPAEMGADVMYDFAMVYQFRFRPVAAVLPEPIMAHVPNAFAAPRDVSEDSEDIREYAETTGVEPTEEGIAFLQRDPMIPESERPPEGPVERMQDALRSRVLDPVRARIVGPIRSRV